MASSIAAKSRMAKPMPRLRFPLLSDRNDPKSRFGTVEIDTDRMPEGVEVGVLLASAVKTETADGIKLAAFYTEA